MDINTMQRTRHALLAGVALTVGASAQEFGNGQDTVPPVTDEQPLEVAEETGKPHAYGQPRRDLPQ